LAATKTTIQESDPPKSEKKESPYKKVEANEFVSSTGGQITDMATKASPDKYYIINF
jgi:hypothetical protein